jgi:hypothetical protein
MSVGHGVGLIVLLSLVLSGNPPVGRIAARHSPVQPTARSPTGVVDTMAPSTRLPVQFVSLSLALVLGAWSAHGATVLSAEAIMGRVIGHTIEFQNDDKDAVRMYFDPNGSAYGTSRRDGVFVQEWQIRFGNFLCIVGDNPMESGCVQVVLPAEGKIEFHRRDDVIEGPFALLPGRAGV